MENNTGLDYLEKCRKEAVKGLWLSIAAGLLVFFSLFIHNFSFFIAIAIFVIPAFIYSSKINKYKTACKQYFIANQFQKILGVQVDIDLSGYNEEYIKASHLIPTSNTYSSDDLISFDYKGVKVRRGDVHTEQVVSTGKSTTRVTLFRGQYMTFTFPKQITSFMVIKDNSFFDEKPDGFFSSAPKTSKVEFESIEFNKMFDVFAENEHEAFYLLTPQFMQLLMDYRKTSDCKVYYGFMRNEFHIAVDTRENLFEPSLFVKVSELSDGFDNQHIYSLKNMMEHFDLVEEQ